MENINEVQEEVNVSENITDEPKKKGPGYVTEKQLNLKLDPINSALALILEKLNSSAEKEVKQDEAAPIGSPENPGVVLNPEWRKIVDEILGPDFGIMVNFDKDGSTMKFTIIVPKDKSNAKQDYMEFYKHDYRTIALNPAATGIGVRQWCERIKRNLGKSQIEHN